LSDEPARAVTFAEPYRVWMTPKESAVFTNTRSDTLKEAEWVLARPDAIHLTNPSPAFVITLLLERLP